MPRSSIRELSISIKDDKGTGHLGRSMTCPAIGETDDLFLYSEFLGTETGDLSLYSAAGDGNARRKDPFE